ncbi:MAG: M20 family metallopeptidase [Phycisphaerae bacterium]|nr:M20 family metallopeptidase [Phycisphaerae bacterium]
MKNLLKKLIEAKSTPDVGEIECAKVLADFFASAGIESNVEIWDKTRANITATVKSSSEKPALLFVSHLDVVPAGKQSWQSDPFEAAERDRKIFGRGACDMKSGMASVAAAMAEIKKSVVNLKSDIIFSATAGEETDSIGIKKFLESFDGKENNLCGAIVPEPTDFKLITAHRGLLWLEITTKGKTAHGSMPHLGINAIESMRVFLDELEHYDITGVKDKLLGTGSMSINKIRGGNATNVIPDKCTVQLDIRTIPEHNHSQIQNDIEAIFAKISQRKKDFSAAIEVIRSVEALKTNSDCAFVNDLKKITGNTETAAAQFTTDAPFIAELNIPVVIFGPGKPDICHKPDEYIEIQDLQKAVEFYKNIILHFAC